MFVFSRTGYTNILLLFFYFCFSVSLAFSCLTFLTIIWGKSAVFIWLLSATGVSSLLVWISIGFISLRFRQAYRAQGLSLSDLPYRQPLYPLLPIGVLVLGTLMFIALGYASVRQKPFSKRSIYRSLYHFIFWIFDVRKVL